MVNSKIIELPTTRHVLVELFQRITETLNPDVPHIICTVTNDLTYDRRMQRICRSLVKGGYRVTLVGRQRLDSEPLRKESYEQLRLRCRYNKGKLFYLDYNWRLLRYLLSHPFDIVNAVDLDTLLPGFWASRIKKKACVYDAHEYFTEVPEVVRRPLVKRTWELAARLTIPRLRYAYTVGPALAEALQQHYNTPFAVIRNVPLQEKATPEANPSGAPVILYQGALNEGRGLEYAVKAMVHLKEAELWLAGEGDLSASLRYLVRDLGLEDRVHFLGFILPENLKLITQQASIGLNLLESRGLSYYYSLANKAFDYIQAGVPSIHMAFPEYRRINEQQRVFHLIHELTVDSVRLAIERLLQDQAYYHQLQQNCLSAREIYTWEQEEAALLDFYGNVAGRG